MADFSLADVPWLTQPADPGGSLLRGVQTGLGVAGVNLQRQGLAQRAMEFERGAKIQEEELRQRAAILPLEILLKRQDSEAKALAIEDALKSREDQLKNEKLLGSLSSDVALSIGSKNLDSAYMMMANAASASPSIISDQRFLKLQEMIDNYARFTAQMTQRAGSAYTPGFGQALNPETGKLETFWRSGSGSAELLKDSPANKPQSTLGKLLADREIAAKAGDTNAVAAFDAELKLRQSKDGFSITTNPDGTVTVTQGNQSSLTPTNQTRVQQGLSDSLSTIDIANRLEPLIDTETVGARSFVETWVKDRVLAQAFPEMASGKRASAESLAAQLRASAVRELKTDSNITEKERSQILQSIPDINAPIDSPARAKQLIGDIRKMSAIRAVVSAVKLGQPMPKPAAQVLNDDELIRLVNTGVITQEQALQIFDARQ